MSLWTDPANAEHLVYAPKKVYSDSSKSSHIFSEMWTAKWWQVLQSKLPSHATISPIILAADKTHLTQFSGNKSAYPVYLTIGNLPKAICRKPSKNACVPIAYLSVDKLNHSEMTELEHCSHVQRIFHESMKTVLEPLKKAGHEVHPILTCYVANYPEQCLVTCTKYSTCVKCQRSADDLQNPKPGDPRTKQWTEKVISDAKKKSKGSSTKFHAECMAHDVAGSVYSPFWQDFTYTDIHNCITPDILHQLYQGIFKHLVGWCQSILERKNMAKILLGCLVDVMAPSALDNFHKVKDYFIRVTDRTHLNLPKLHFLVHYVNCIELFGTTDNYNTEMFERLHIDFAKHGWQATNQHDEFPQMIHWLSHQEKVLKPLVLQLLLSHLL
ncbi:hypothetical protein BYT27DRAFT_7220800 [Phlegmacium glaucopus]|nr:hypothetical protein BYT27DRAFT_7220800 [Phlegmacium glaucopus]